MRLGSGEKCWQDASRAVMCWEVKTRSGFDLTNRATPRSGGASWISFGWGPLRIWEPIRVVDVVDLPNRQGLSYGTLTGHPISGEEAFIVHRDSAGAVFFTLRSLSSSGVGWWRIAFPAVLLAQRWFRRRYLRAALSVTNAAGEHT